MLTRSFQEPIKQNDNFLFSFSQIIRLNWRYLEVNLYIFEVIKNLLLLNIPCELALISHRTFPKALILMLIAK